MVKVAPHSGHFIRVVRCLHFLLAAGFRERPPAGRRFIVAALALRPEQGWAGRGFGHDANGYEPPDSLP